MLTLSQYPFTQIKGNKKSEAAGDRRGSESGNSPVMSSGDMEPGDSGLLGEGQAPRGSPSPSREFLGFLLGHWDVFASEAKGWASFQTTEPGQRTGLKRAAYGQEYQTGVFRKEGDPRGAVPNTRGCWPCSAPRMISAMTGLMDVDTGVHRRLWKQKPHD